MRCHLSLTVAILGLSLSVVGCSKPAPPPANPKAAKPWFDEKKHHRKGEGPSTPQQDAILKVLDEDRQHFKTGFETLQADSQPSNVSKMIADYLSHRDQADLAPCPSEFVAAHQRHTKAWRQLQTALARLPDAYEGLEFMDALFGLFHGDSTKGRPLGGDVIQAVKKINQAFAEEYTAAEVYGIETDRR